jgi:hypothetical protein
MSPGWNQVAIPARMNEAAFVFVVERAALRGWGVDCARVASGKREAAETTLTGTCYALING